MSDLTTLRDALPEFAKERDWDQFAPSKARSLTPGCD
jgi:hypothetical protein